MEVAPSKCECISFTKSRRLTSKTTVCDLVLNNSNLNTSEIIRDLGVLFNSSLQFDVHITQALRKAQRRINMIFNVLRSVRELMEISFAWQIKPWLKLKPLWYLTGYGYEYDKHLAVVTDFTKAVIQEKWEEFKLFHVDGEAKDKRSMAFLDLLLEMRSEGLLNEEDIREEVDTFMFEGHDTTSASMGWTLWSMATHPDVQEKVIEEVDRIFGSSDRDCTNDDLKQMKYLEKCLKESLRMFPSVPFFARKVEQDVVINGETFPKGVRILVAPMVLHRNPRIFNNPNDYNPENYSEEAIASRHAYADVPFSAGPRNCIGQKFAIMEEKAVISWFFRRYRVSTHRKFHDNQMLPEIILKSTLGFPLKIHNRHDLVNM
uniref:Cytochrome P450 n=1 Tax=Caenorhabditis japonica TaxID=281687 RepID=A0A8R1HMQ8_CAEJA